jgi:hypothetical protein
MKISRRMIGIIFFISIILLVGTLFWPFVLNKIIEPTSLAIWLLLRIFVLSIDQKYYWGAIIFVIAIFLFRLLPQNQIDIQSDNFLESNAAIKNVEYWRVLFTQTGQSIQDEETLKRELTRLLLSFYASKHCTSTNFLLYESLQRGELPLPVHIHKFLFSDKPKKTKWSLNQFIQSVGTAARKWIRRWTGQEAAEYYRMIDDVLSFMERAMEMKNDDGKLNQN